jgi:transmembrane protein TMEM260 (protein O-mannosyltransferase)
MTERRLFFLLIALALALYLPTASGLVTWSHSGEDGPELEGAARTLGVAHPPGYPLFTLGAHVIGTFLPPPASAVNLLTLLAAAVAVGAVGLLTARLLARIGFRNPWPGGGAGALFFAVSPIWWKQASIGEVYPLHLAIVALAFACLVRGTPRELLLAAYVFGLGLAHHPLTVPALAVALVYVLLRRYRLGAVHALLLLFPLTLYGVLLLRSRLDPAFDWGDPRVLSRLWWVVSGVPYHQNLLREGWGPVSAAWTHAIRYGPITNLGWGGALLAVMGAGVLARRGRPELVALGLLFLGSSFAACAYDIPDPAAYFLPSVLALAVLAGVGSAGLGRALAAVRRPRVRMAVLASSLGAGAACLAAQGQLSARAAASARDLTAFDYARGGEAVLEKNALVVSRGDGRTFSLWYGTSVLASRPDVAVVYETMLDWPWYRRWLTERYPDLLIPPRAPEEARRVFMVMENLPRRPVYVTEVSPQMESRFDVSPAGPLYRLRAPVTARASSETKGRVPPPGPPG